MTYIQHLVPRTYSHPEKILMLGLLTLSTFWVISLFLPSSEGRFAVEVLACMTEMAITAIYVTAKLTISRQQAECNKLFELAQKSKADDFLSISRRKIEVYFDETYNLRIDRSLTEINPYRFGIFFSSLVYLNGLEECPNTITSACQRICNEATASLGFFGTPETFLSLFCDGAMQSRHKKTVGNMIVEAMEMAVLTTQGRALESHAEAQSANNQEA